MVDNSGCKAVRWNYDCKVSLGREMVDNNECQVSLGGEMVTMIVRSVIDNCGCKADRW